MQTEVRHNEPVPASNHQILGFNVTMHYTLIVEYFHGAQKLINDEALFNAREERASTHAIMQRRHKLLAEHIARCTFGLTRSKPHLLRHNHGKSTWIKATPHEC